MIDPTRRISLCFAVSAAASIGLTVVYALGGQPQLEGTLLGIALGSMAIGLILWAHGLMPGGSETQPRKPFDDAPGPDEDAEPVPGVERRSFLAKLLAGAVGALGIAALFPIRSLGEAPGSSLNRTSWTTGLRLVTKEGEPVAVTDMEIGGFITVFPDGHLDAADSQTVLLRVDPTTATPIEGREDWVPEGFMAYSKICTHAGCPIGLYQPATGELFCPCHQSVFDATDGAAPAGGPATRPLPQLPLAVDDEGYLIAQGDFSEPVGPGFWSLG
jgi:ubiquinol-cytochrome c reductase iron-sulfur subunit